MPRLARAIGPAGDFELTGALQDVPDMVLQIATGDGPLLVLAKARCNNASAGAIIFTLLPTLDGANLAPNAQHQSIPAGARATGNWFSVTPCTAGLHTIKLRSSGGAGLGDTITMNSAELVAIELPNWELPLDLTA